MDSLQCPNCFASTCSTAPAAPLRQQHTAPRNCGGRRTAENQSASQAPGGCYAPLDSVANRHRVIAIGHRSVRTDDQLDARRCPPIRLGEAPSPLFADEPVDWPSEQRSAARPSPAASPATRQSGARPRLRAAERSALRSIERPARLHRCPWIAPNGLPESKVARRAEHREHPTEVRRTRRDYPRCG